MYCLTFGVIKADLEPIQQHAFDHFARVRQATHSWADELDTFIVGRIQDFPKGKGNQTDYMLEELKKASAKSRVAYEKLKSLLESMYTTKSVALDKMWADFRQEEPLRHLERGELSFEGG